MSKSLKIQTVFEPKLKTLQLEALLPTRDIKPSDNSFGKYKSILASIPQIGLVEPIAVYPCRGRKGRYVVLDGHMRLKALKELGHEEAPCLISTEDDSFTYNDKVTRISFIQESKMILRAIEQGVKEEDIAQTLAVDIKKVRQSVTAFQEIDPYVVEKVKAKPVTAATLRLFRKVKLVRQQIIADLMIAGNDCSFAYVNFLVQATPSDLLVTPEKRKIPATLKPEDAEQMTQEIQKLEKEFQISQNNYGQNMLSFSIIQRYLQRILDNANIRRFLTKNHSEIHETLVTISTTDSL